MLELLPYLIYALTDDGRVVVPDEQFRVARDRVTAICAVVASFIAQLEFLAPRRSGASAARPCGPGVASER